MKVAVVPVSMMQEQLHLWAMEREVSQAELTLENRIRGVEAQRTLLANKQQELFDTQTRIAAARGSIRKLLEK